MNQQLPSADAPLVLADGTTIDPTTGTTKNEVSTYVEIPNGTHAQEIVGRTRRRIVDLPEPPRTMNAVGVVLMYTMYGLATQDIAIATNLTVEQIENIRVLDAYRALEAEIVDNILTVDSEHVKAILATASHNAARRVANLMDSPHEDIALSAAKDVLNRTGHTAAEERARVDLAEQLNIVITIKNDNDQRPTIDITGERT